MSLWQKQRYVYILIKSGKIRMKDVIHKNCISATNRDTQTHSAQHNNKDMQQTILT